MAAAIGGGGIFTASAVKIDAIRSAGLRRRHLLGSAAGPGHVAARQLQSAAVDVDWHITVPPAVMGLAASLVATVSATSAEITVSFDGVVVSATAIAMPTVFTEPDVDCIGSWLDCRADCRQFFCVTTVASGHGSDCRTRHGVSKGCAAGVGECPSGRQNGTLLVGARLPALVGSNLGILLLGGAGIAGVVAFLCVVFLKLRPRQSTPVKVVSALDTITAPPPATAAGPPQQPPRDFAATQALIQNMGFLHVSADYLECVWAIYDRNDDGV